MSAIKSQKNPRFPRHTLEQSILNVTKIYKAIGKAQSPKAVVVKALGYSPSSSSGSTALATLSGYGLIKRGGENRAYVSLSKIAQRIILSTGEDRENAIKEASLSPKLFEEFQAHYGEELDRSAFENTLVLDDRFTEKGAELATKIYYDNLGYIEKTCSNQAIEADETKPEPATPTAHQSPPTTFPAQDYATIPIGTKVAHIPVGISEQEYQQLSSFIEHCKGIIVIQKTTDPSPH